MKRLLALITSALLTASAVPFSASAESNAEIKSGIVDGVTYYYSDWDSATMEIRIVGAENASGDIVIPKFIDGYMVEGIAERAFFCNTEITSVTFPDVLPFIGDHAFTGCTALERVILPSNDATLGKGCFESCIGLKYLNLGSSITSIPDDCFMSCNKLAAVDIPKSVSNIGDQAFYGCTDLRKIVLENKSIQLGFNSFGSYYDLRKGGTDHLAGFTVYGVTGSTAEEYASNFDYDFVELKGEIVGDADMSGTLSAADASAVLKEYADTTANYAPTFTALQRKNGDLDKDGMLTAKDASMILSIYANSQM